MPFFEYKKEKTKLVEEPPQAVVAESSDSLAVAEVQSAEGAPEPTTIEEIIPLRSRKTKPLDWKGVLFGSIMLVSIAVPAVVLVGDSASRFFVCGFVQDLLNDDVNAVESFTMAIAIRKDGTFYKHRALAYGSLKPPNLEGEYNDLLAALQLKTHDYLVLHPAITLAARLGHRDSAVKLSRDLADFSHGFTKDKHPFRSEASYNLLLLGEDKLATNLLNQPTKSDTEAAIRALILRETQPVAARDIAKKTFGEYCSFFAHAKRYKNMDGAIVPDILNSLFLLDNKKPQDAAKSLARLRGNASVDLKGYPIINLLEAWTCYAQGDFNQCLILTEPLIVSHQKNRNDDDDYDSLDESIEGLNIMAAAHLLRQHAYLECNDAKQAEIEKRSYESNGNTGKIFVPLPYRSWLGDAPP